MASLSWCASLPRPHPASARATVSEQPPNEASRRPLFLSFGDRLLAPADGSSGAKDRPWQRKSQRSPASPAFALPHVATRTLAAALAARIGGAAEGVRIDATRCSLPRGLHSRRTGSSGARASACQPRPWQGRRARGWAEPSLATPCWLAGNVNTRVGRIMGRRRSSSLVVVELRMLPAAGLRADRSRFPLLVEVIGSRIRQMELFVPPSIVLWRKSHRFAGGVTSELELRGVTALQELPTKQPTIIDADQPWIAARDSRRQPTQAILPADLVRALPAVIRVQSLPLSQFDARAGSTFAYRARGCCCFCDFPRHARAAIDRFGGEGRHFPFGRGGFARRIVADWTFGASVIVAAGNGFRIRAGVALSKSHVLVDWFSNTVACGRAVTRLSKYVILVIVRVLASTR
jgi:hypothetical protein